MSQPKKSTWQNLASMFGLESAPVAETPAPAPATPAPVPPAAAPPPAPPAALPPKERAAEPRAAERPNRGPERAPKAERIDENALSFFDEQIETNVGPRLPAASRNEPPAAPESRPTAPAGPPPRERVPRSAPATPPAARTPAATPPAPPAPNVARASGEERKPRRGAWSELAGSLGLTPSEPELPREDPLATLFGSSPQPFTHEPEPIAKIDDRPLGDEEAEMAGERPAAEYDADSPAQRRRRRRRGSADRGFRDREAPRSQSEPRDEPAAEPEYFDDELFAEVEPSANPPSAPDSEYDAPEFGEGPPAHDQGRGERASGRRPRGRRGRRGGRDFQREGGEPRGEAGHEGNREGNREAGREGNREGGREGRREGGRERSPEGARTPNRGGSRGEAGPRGEGRVPPRRETPPGRRRESGALDEEDDLSTPAADEMEYGGYDLDLVSDVGADDELVDVGSPHDETDASESDMADEGDDLGDDAEGELGRPGHRQIPDWLETVNIIISANMEARRNSPGGNSRNRGRGGRGNDRRR